MMISLLTASMELLVFGWAATLVVGPALLVVRWFVGASGALGNFFLNRNFAFQRIEESRTRQGVRYATVAVSAVTLASGLWWLLQGLTSADPRLLHVLSMVSVWMIFTYPMMERWVFGRTEPELG